MKSQCNKPIASAIALGLLYGLAGCAAAPSVRGRPVFLSHAQETVVWFEENVRGLREQIRHSAGYTVFPNMLQYGTGLGGGKFGRGMVATADGTQIGWSAINTSSLGLQAGIQDFKMLVVFQNDATLTKFKANRLSGASNGVAILADVGGSRTAPFENGVAIYQGANVGLMAGVNVGLDLIRFETVDSKFSEKKPRNGRVEMSYSKENGRKYLSLQTIYCGMSLVAPGCILGLGDAEWKGDFPCWQ